MQLNELYNTVSEDVCKMHTFRAADEIVTLKKCNDNNSVKLEQRSLILPPSKLFLFCLLSTNARLFVVLSTQH